MVKRIIDIKGEMSMMNVVHLYQADIDAIEHAIEVKMAEAEAFFKSTALIVDCQSLGEACHSLNFARLFECIKQSGFVPVGIRHLPEACHPDASEAGWAILRSGKTKSTKTASVAIQAETEKQSPSGEACVKVIDRPLRSGQQVFAPSGDVVILHQTSAGSEILAGGSVHVYGALRGRVLAGINGDQTARIFCQSLEAELVSIAGCYQLLDDTETSLKGQAAMIRLVDNKLLVEPMF